ncbi:Piwi domain-containing protein [Suillus fuscotomentosus]|uniref:Piwi domain-containing protein n=1 Tax=Suillus fuscotomentosus TaxID=1912939 RepID=A0AAD4HJ05_9AGAM|nr:Piwi domain-containing protein [Suillus fuscotomentosus]KAG1898378.1 Piwi domain-containing protein [Suillus fuscotomentosus]
MSNPSRGRGGPRGSYPGGPRGGAGGFSGGRGSSTRGGYGGGSRGGVPGDLIFRGPASVDQRLATLDELVSSFNKLTFNPERPHRPGFGTLGRQITLRANFFPIKLPKGPIYDYHVEITPSTDIKRIRARLFKLLEQSNQQGWEQFVPFIAHDSSQRLVSAKKLPQPLDVQVQYYEEGEAGPNARSKTYTFAIIHTADLDIAQLTKYLSGDIKSRDYDVQPVVAAVNLVLQTHAARTGVRVGKNRYFFPSQERFELALGIEGVKGFFTSARPTYNELMVNVGVCMTAFYKPGNLADAMMAFQRSSDGAMPQRFTQKLKVTTRHLGYAQKKPIKKIMPTSPRRTFFHCEEYGKISVEEYFRKKYPHITLRHADDLPVVDISGPNSKFSIYVPAELCEIEPGQPFRGRLNEKETSNMIRFACNPPKVNADAIIENGLPTLGFTPGTLGSPLSGFGITVDNNMAVVPGRELPPPRLTYEAGGRPLNVSNGSWNILDVKFHNGGAIKSWWVMVVREKDGRSVFSGADDPVLTGIWRGFGEKCRNSGISLGSQPVKLAQSLVSRTEDPGRQQALGSIRQKIEQNISEKGKPSFILVLLSRRDNFIYPGIKRICDVELGVHTIHMLTDKVVGKDPNKQDQYFSNIALKLNTKLGGINHVLDSDSLKWLTKAKTMVVGMDVTHPGPGSIEGTPSIAAVVASVDSYFVQFPASLRCQETKKEMITDLADMMIDRLRLYAEKNQSLPDRVFIYRDGVSEGQFNTVLEEELPKIREAFKRVPQRRPYRPLLTIIICGKRHHAKFWPTDSQFADRNGNTRPGTVVDRGVTAVFDFDFYLQPHVGLQGHVKATHYTVVYDENRLGADELQQGTHTASYLYARATKAVSLVPAAYYADLACERGRCYLNDFLSTDDKMSSSVVSGKGRGKGKVDKEEEKIRVFKEAKKAWGEGVHPDLRESMFYI